MSLNESIVEAATLVWFEGLGYAYKNGLLIRKKGGKGAEHAFFQSRHLAGIFSTFCPKPPANE